MRRAFITGTAGFIGFHLAKHLLRNGWAVAGLDRVTKYYDVTPSGFAPQSPMREGVAAFVAWFRNDYGT